MLASVAFAPQDGQAANFEVFMLPAMTAAILLRRAGRARSAGVAVAIATLTKQTGAATLLPILYLVWRAPRKRGVADAAVGFTIPIAIVALLVGPGELLFWAVLGNGSYFGLGSASAYVAGLFAVMTLAFIACNLPIVWSLPRAWRDRKLPSPAAPTARCRATGSPVPTPTSGSGSRRPRCRSRSGSGSSGTTTCSCSRRCACSAGGVD